MKAFVSSLLSLFLQCVCCIIRRRSREEELSSHHSDDFIEVEDIKDSNSIRKEE